MNEPPVTDEELRKIRAILIQDERVIWLWASVRKWVAGTAIFIAALIAFWKDIVEIFATLFRGSP